MREGDLTYDDFLQRLNIQDVLIDAGYHLNRRDGLRYPSYVRLDSEGRRIRGDKFIVTQQGKCCFQAQQQKVYNIISFIMAGGYEVRSRYFKGCIPPKSVSLVKANDIPADECLVFEGFMDFLSAVTLGVTGNADCLVLNSVANVEKAAGLLDGYGRIGCFLDRDEAGRRTLAALTMRYGERVTDRSSLYDGCKDLNEYLQLTTKKQKNNHLKIEEQ